MVKGAFQPLALTEFERRVAAIFLFRTRKAKQAAVEQVIRTLGIKRIVTLNYDLELERAVMLRRDEVDFLSDCERAARGECIDTQLELDMQNRANQSPIELLGSGEFKHNPIVTNAIRFAEHHKILLGTKLSSRAKPTLLGVADFIEGEGGGGAASNPHGARPIERRSRDRLVRTMPDGLKVISDVAHRERPDRLFEFAVGSTEVSRHIFICTAEPMSRAR